MKVGIISGSARAGNNTLRVAYALKKLHESDDAEIVDFQQYDIPLINQGKVGETAFEKNLIRVMDSSDLIYIITPEYNWSTTPEILNWLHRYGDRNFAGLFSNKVFALVGVSTGKGGKAPLLHLTGVLNKVISFLALESFVSPRIFESHFTKEVVTESGDFSANPEYQKGISLFVAYTKKMTERWFGINGQQ